MLKRVLAWVLLAGFIFLLLNIAIFQYFLPASIMIYLVIAIWFILTNKPLPSRKNKPKATTENTNEKYPEGYNEDYYEEFNEEHNDEPTDDTTQDSTKD